MNFKIFFTIIVALIIVSGCTSQSLPSIRDAEEEIRKAEIKIQEAREEGKEIELSEQTLTQAKIELEKAKQAFKDGNSDKADELAENSKDLAAESRMKYIGKTSEDLQ